MAYLPRASLQSRRPFIKRRNKPPIAFSQMTISDPDGNRVWTITWNDALNAFQITAVMNPSRITVQPVTANAILLS